MNECSMLKKGDDMEFLEDRKLAEELLEWARSKNPGRWVDHSLHVARAAEIVAAAMKKNGYSIDPNIAYICGILHDIGRYYGFTPSVIHSYHGYQFMMERGYSGNANVCVTHSFPIGSKHIEYCNGWGDVPEAIQVALIHIINGISWNIYDKLITLCDAVSEANGFTLIEKRLVSVAIRSGTNEFIPQHWRGFYEIKHEIEEVIGMSIYRLLPGLESSIYTTILLDNP